MPMFAGPGQTQQPNKELINNGFVDSKMALQQPKGQARTVTGTVIDEKGEPVIGATIKVKGKNSGTITDLDGNFTLQVLGSTTLTVSYVGYISQDITVGNAKSYKIQLKQNQQALNEVVVVGYGSSTKRDLIASVSAIEQRKSRMCL